MHRLRRLSREPARWGPRQKVDDRHHRPHNRLAQVVDDPPPEPQGSKAQRSVVPRWAGALRRSEPMDCGRTRRALREKRGKDGNCRMAPVHAVASSAIRRSRPMPKRQRHEHTPVMIPLTAAKPWPPPFARTATLTARGPKKRPSRTPSVPNVAAKVVAPGAKLV